MGKQEPSAHFMIVILTYLLYKLPSKPVDTGASVQGAKLLEISFPSQKNSKYLHQDGQEVRIIKVLTEKYWRMIKSMQ